MPSLLLGDMIFPLHSPYILSAFCVFSTLPSVVCPLKLCLAARLLFPGAMAEQHLTAPVRYQNPRALRRWCSWPESRLLGMSKHAVLPNHAKAPEISAVAANQAAAPAVRVPVPSHVSGSLQHLDGERISAAEHDTSRRAVGGKDAVHEQNTRVETIDRDIIRS